MLIFIRFYTLFQFSTGVPFLMCCIIGNYLILLFHKIVFLLFFSLPAMKYLLVTGGVISGIGKGIVSSSIGAILKANGWNVTCIKIDPYLNIDAGTFSPYEHGEVYVLDDGSEVDLDLGNYERYLDVKLTHEHNITTGKIYQLVTQRERRGEYLGKTVQVRAL